MAIRTTVWGGEGYANGIEMLNRVGWCVRFRCCVVLSVVRNRFLGFSGPFFLKKTPGSNF